jgi:hypothetical protein
VSMLLKNTELSDDIIEKLKRSDLRIVSGYALCSFTTLM